VTLPIPVPIRLPISLTVMLTLQIGLDEISQDSIVEQNVICWVQCLWIC